MKPMKKLAALLLSAALLSLPVSAAGLDPAGSAEALHALGLFQGTIPGRFDEESMALGRTATRAEALTMFLRLTGREGDALSGGWEHPFSDVDAWAAPYVGYAYTQGLTQGTGDGRFGSAQLITLDEYVTFLLRALGYDEASGDFTWDAAGDKGLALGLYDSTFAEGCAGDMTRGALAQVSYAALSLSTKDGGETLAGTLVRLGAVEADALAPLDIPLAPQPDAQEPAPGPGGSSGASTAPSKPGDTSGQGDASTPGGTPGPGEAEKNEPTPEPSPKPTPDAGSGAAQDSIQAVADLVNEARAEEGLPPLALDEELTAFAATRAEEIGTLFAHTRPDGSTCFTILTENNYRYQHAGENIASGQRTAQEVVASWLNSPGHRANILSPKFGRIGVGLVGTQWVQLFTD